MFIPEGDGIPTKYYNNEMFDGAPINLVHEKIEFDWENDSPIEKINPDNYSVVYKIYFIKKDSKDMLEALLQLDIFLQLSQMTELRFI